VLAVVLPAVVTVVGLAGHALFTQATHATGFVLAVVVTALVGGLGPAVLAAAAGGAALNFFFTEPTHSFDIASAGDVVAVIVMVVVAVLVALVVDRAARRAEQAARAGTEAALLASFARIVLTHAEPLPRLLARLREAFTLESVALLERVEDTGWRLVAGDGPRLCLTPGEGDAGVRIDEDVHLAVRGRPLPAHDRRVLDAVAGQALLALRQQRMVAATADARRHAHATELRAALLSAVGHDLRTPLTSIKAAAGALRDPALRLSPEDTGELLATVEESADRLRALVDNLLDSSRLAAGTVVPRRRAVGYDEVVARALSTVDGTRTTVVVDVDERLPMVLADPGLLERVVANLVDNALRHSGAREIAVRASAHAGRVELRVVDDGRGVREERLDTLFRPGPPGPAGGSAGLGLSVARGFVEAMGGTIGAEDTPGGGLTVAVSLPAAAPAAVVTP
jgi:two-component system, OmpR family, sensor histidine kinase KdpD